MSAIVHSLNSLWHCLLLGLEWKLTFSSPVSTYEFSRYAGILSAALSQDHLLGFEIAQLEFHHLHLTSHSRMSGSRWVITLRWLSGSWRSFLYSSVYSCHLFWISSASVRSIHFLSFIVLIFVWNVPLVSLIFLTRSLVFPNLLFSTISLHWSLKFSYLSSIFFGTLHSNGYLSFFPLPFASLLFSAICKGLSFNHFALLHFFFLGMVLILASYTMSQASVHSSSGTLSIRFNPLNLFVTSTVKL